MLQLIYTVQILVSVNTRVPVMYAYDAKGTHEDAILWLILGLWTRIFS